MVKEKIIEALKIIGKKTADYLVAHPEQVVKGVDKAANGLRGRKAKKEKLASLESENEALKNENEELKKTLEDAEAVIKEVRQKFEEIVAYNEELTHKVDEVRSEKEELESTLIEKEYQIIDYEAVHKRDLIIEIALGAALIIAIAFIFIF